MIRSEQKMGLPIIATMIGDSAGIGPEVAFKAAVSGELAGVCHPLLIGDIASIRAAAVLASPIDFSARSTIDKAASVAFGASCDTLSLRLAAAASDLLAWLGDIDFIRISFSIRSTGGLAFTPPLLALPMLLV